MPRIPLAVRTLLCALMFTQLSACSNARFAINRAKTLTWNTPSLNQTECPKLDGLYEDLNLLNAKLYSSLISNYQRMREEGAFSSELYALTAHAARYKTPDRNGTLQFAPFANRGDQLAYEIEDTIFTRDQSLLELKTPNSHIVEAVHLDKGGKRYWKHIYRLDKNGENFTSGCFQNALIIRRLGFSGPEGNHFVITTATETHFTKLPNGDLQVSTNERVLNLKSDTPRIENTVEVFKLYKPSAP